MRQKISMVCPTRERTIMLDKFVKNVYNKGTKELSSEDCFELLIIADNDDRETIEFFNKELSAYKTVKLITRERSSFFNKDYLTFGASNSSGDLIWGIADDVEILVNNWNEVLLNKVNKFESLVDSGTLANHFYNWKPNDLAYYINLDCGDGDFQNYSICRCSFPILTREAFEKLNFFAPHAWKFWGADYGLGEIYRRAGRVLSLSEIKVAHWSWANNNSEYLREKDSTNKNSEEISSECGMVGALYRKEEDVINKYVEILTDKDYIKKYIPSRIGFEVLANPINELASEIFALRKAYDEMQEKAAEVAMECPKCKFENYHFEFEAPTCPIHTDPMESEIWKIDDKEYSKEYGLTLSCSAEECKVVYTVTEQPLSCPNPVCDYEGLFDFQLHKTIDAQQKSQNLQNRLNSLIQKYNDMKKILQENKSQCHSKILEQTILHILWQWKQLAMRISMRLANG